MPGKAIIRAVEECDAPEIAAIYAPNVMEGVASFELEPPDSAEMQRRVLATSAQYPWLVCELAGEVIGYVYASNHNPRAAYQWSVNVTVYINARQRRSGIGGALYTSLFALLKLQGFYNAYGGITLPNAGSVGLHESLGFDLIGVYRHVGYKFGRWHDVGWWGLDLQLESLTDPASPLSTGDLFVHPDYARALQSGASLLRI